MCLKNVPSMLYLRLITRNSSKVIENRRTFTKIVVIRLVTGTLILHLVLCVGDVVKEDISVVSALQYFVKKTQTFRFE